MTIPQLWSRRRKRIVYKSFPRYLYNFRKKAIIILNKTDLVNKLSYLQWTTSERDRIAVSPKAKQIGDVPL